MNRMKTLWASWAATGFFLVAIAGLSGFTGGCGGAAAGGSGGTGGSTPAIADGLDLPEGTNAILTVHTSTATPAALTVETSAGTVEIDTALLGLKEIELETDEEGESETDIDLEGPFVVDLVNDTVENLGTSNIDDDCDDDGVEDSNDTDDDEDGIDDSEDSDDDGDSVADTDDSVMDESDIFDALELPVGTYTEIKARLEPIDVEDGIDPASPLAGKSIYVVGSLEGQPFRFEADFDDEFVVQDETGIVVSDSSIASFVLTFNVAGWFDGVDLSTATVDSDGVVVLSDESNTEIFNQIKENIQSSSEIENDDDGDGTPDDEDLDDSGSDS